MNQYVSDVIGDDYKEWKESDVILINAQTGAGKTYFILYVLLKYAQENHRTILYLVNRRILKKQLEMEILKLPSAQQNLITIETYQNIETRIKNVSQKIFDLNNNLGFGNFDYVVCDEAHYFSVDANFNTNTILSYCWIQHHFENKICIYISATIDLLKKHMDEDLDKYGRICTEIYRFASDYKDYRLGCRGKK